MIQLPNSLIHYLAKTINTEMKILREQVQFIQNFLELIFIFNLLDHL